MEMIRLEYNEYQGAFHFNYGLREPNKFAWMTICSSLSYNQSVEFAELILEKYPAINFETKSLNSKDYPSLELIKQEFVNFLLT
ncbi:MAG: hypothetical protein H0U95_04335 [Bacteroidetes bacterium]|nr:hypothetical protein [Bacteroidota bacterium]